MAGSEAPPLPRVQEFITYYEETWLVGNYPLPLWNVFESGSVHTNNHVEGWHSRLKKVVGKAHPNSLSRRNDTFFCRQNESRRNEPKSPC